MRRERGMELGREKREADGESPDKRQNERHQKTESTGNTSIMPFTASLFPVAF